MKDINHEKVLNENDLEKEIMKMSMDKDNVLTKKNQKIPQGKTFFIMKNGMEIAVSEKELKFYSQTN